MKATAEIQAIPIGAGVSVRREVQRARTAQGIRSDHRDPRLGNERRRRPLPDPPSGGTRPRGPPRGGDSSAHHRREARDANRQSAHPRGQAPLTAALPGGRRLVPPGPSGRGRELPLGFEPVVPVGADGLAPRQPEVVGVDRDLLGGGTPVLSPRAEGRRNATLLGPQRLGFARCRGRRRFALAGRGRGLGGPLPTGLALIDDQESNVSRSRGVSPVGNLSQASKSLSGM